MILYMSFLTKDISPRALYYHRKYLHIFHFRRDQVTHFVVELALFWQSLVVRKVSQVSIQRCCVALFEPAKGEDRIDDEDMIDV